MPRVAASLRHHGIHYGWVMVSITFLTMLATAASMGMSGILLIPLRQEFGWTTTQISGAMAVRLVLFGLMGPLAAALMRRYGVRGTVITALTLIVAGLSLATQMTQLWQLWLTWGVLVGIGTGMTAIVLGATIASRWFHTRRGLVLGLLTASAAAGQLAFLPVSAWMNDMFGWRCAVVPPIAACAVAALAMLVLGVDSPESIGLHAYGLPQPTAEDGRRRASRIADVPRACRPGRGPLADAFAALADAAGTRVFWVLFFTFGVCGFTTNGLVQTHFIPLCADFGMPQLDGAAVLALMGICDFGGTIIAGWLSDRFDSGMLLGWFYGARGLALLILPLSSFSVSGLSLFALIYGLDWIATVPPTVKLAARTFGAERAPLVFGWVFTAHQLGAATAAIGGGVSRDLMLSYFPAFLLGALLCLIAAMAAIRTRGAITRRHAA
jgi:MFS family permease